MKQKQCNTEMIDVQPIQLIRINQVVEMTGLSRSTVYAIAADGIFPKSVSLVPNGCSRAWVYAEVQDWISGRIAERDTGDES